MLHSNLNELHENTKKMTVKFADLKKMIYEQFESEEENESLQELEKENQ